MYSKLLMSILGIGLSLSGCNCGIAQKSLSNSSNTHNKTQLTASSSGYLLGAPVFSINGSTYIDAGNFTSCLKNLSADTAVGPYGQAPTQYTEMALSVTQVKESLSNVLEGTISININDTGTANIVAKIEKNTNMDARNLVLYVSSTIVQPITFQNAVKFKELTPNCGVGYVNIINAGIDFKGIISIRFDDQYQKNAAEAQITLAGINRFDASANLKLKDILSKYHTEIDISILQTGGDSYQIFEIFKQYQPQDGEVIKLTNVNVNNFNDLMNMFWSYANNKLKEQFISNMSGSFTLDSIRRNFILTYSNKIPSATAKYSSSISLNYDQNILKLLAHANEIYKNLISENLNFSNYLNIMNRVGVYYKNKETYDDYRTTANTAIDQLHGAYRDTTNNLIRNSTQLNTNDLDSKITAAEASISTLQTTEYSKGYKITGIGTTPVYLLPYTKDDPSLVYFLSYTPLKNLNSAIYTPYIEYELDNSKKTLKVFTNNTFPDFAPKLNFSLTNAYLDLNNNTLNYDIAKYYSNQDDTEQPEPSSGALKGMFELITMSRY